jgi:predicted transcriptional regulator
LIAANIRETTEVPMKTLRIDRAIHGRLKAVAKRERRLLAGVAEEAILEYLERRQVSTRIRAISVDGGVG